VPRKRQNLPTNGVTPQAEVSVV